MRENILHFIWQHQYFTPGGIKTTGGETIQVLKPGFINTNAGPDFEQAKIRIGEVEWNGDVEIHVSGSDWLAHGHQNDQAYNKVILHVVWEDNGDMFRKDGTVMPVLELKEVVDSALLERASALLESIETIPCASQLHLVSDLTVVETVHRALIRRLERKAQTVLNELSANKGDWSETAYRLLMRHMGMKVNGDSFYELARAVPYKLIRKYKHSQILLEALLFGASGLLESQKNEAYVDRLKEEYNFLIHKHELEKRLTPEQWKFMRLRPANFPTLRIAQVVSILSKPVDVFEMFTEYNKSDALFKFLKADTSDYWKSHYRFGPEARKKIPALGKASVDILVLNVVAPLLAAYSISISDNAYMEKAISISEVLKPENNRITRQWSGLGVRVGNGAESQGLIELYNEYCKEKACLSCGIGFKILNFKV